ncbi:MAG: ATP synthase subunit C [Gammaproteobacteria bacterium]|jgi:V/A-type H+/Na+-transporting ATPase subunit K
MNAHNKTLYVLIAFAGVIAVLAGTMLWLSPAMAEEVATKTALSPEVLQGGFWAAALATGLSSLGAGFAVASVGSAAIGALTEKPELLGRVLIMVGLAEGIAIYGLIVSILILNELI